jgi:TP901 family phage tail tape measure protein
MAEKSVSVRLSANVDAYKRAMADAQQATKTFESQTGADLKKVGATMTNVGSKMTVGLTLPIVAAGAGALKLSSDFNTAFAQMQGLAGVTSDEVAGLKESVLGLAGETARSPQELAEALYFAASAGLSTAEAMDATTIAAQAAQVGLGSTQDVVGLVASAMASYGSANIDAAAATDILVATIREGRAEPAELASTLGRVLPIASQLGVSFDQVGGAVAYLSNVFGDTNRTVTATQGLMVKLLSPTQQGRDALADMGTSVEELHSAIDQDGLLGALELLRAKGFDGNAQALRALFDDIEGYQAATALLSADQSTLNDIFSATAGSAGALGESMESLDDDSMALKQSWVDIQIALIQVGEIIGPIAAEIAGGVSSITGAFAELPTEVQYAVVGVVAFVAAIGPMLKLGGMLVTNLAAIRTGMILLKTAMLGHPLLAFATIAATVGTAVYLMADNVDHAKEATDSLADSMVAAGSAGTGLADWLLGLTQENESLVRVMDEAGVTISEVAAAARAGGSAWDEMSATLDRARDAAGLNTAENQALSILLAGMPTLAKDAAEAMAARARVDDTAAAAAGGAATSYTDLGEQIASANVQTEESIAITEEAAATMAEYIDDVLSAVSAVFDYERATLALEDSSAAYMEQAIKTEAIMNDSTLTAGEKQAALRELRGAELDNAESALALAEAYAREMGASDGTAESARIQIGKLQELQDEYPHLRDEIDVYIDKILEVPGTVDTRATFDASSAHGEIDYLNQRIYLLRMAAAGVRVGRAGSSAPFVPEGAAADGAIVDRPTVLLTGEAGKEVVIPLTRPQRAMQLAEESGLMNLLGSQLRDVSSARSAAPSALPSMVTLIVEGEPIKARIIDHERAQVAELMAGVR